MPRSVSITYYQGPPGWVRRYVEAALIAAEGAPNQHGFLEEYLSRLTAMRSGDFVVACRGDEVTLSTADIVLASIRIEVTL